MLLPMHRPIEFGWGRGRFCHAEQLQNWTLTREIILVGSQEEQILGAAATDPQSHNASPSDLLCLLNACVRGCPPITSASSGSRRPGHTQKRWESARRAEAGMHEHQNKAGLVQF